MSNDNATPPTDRMPSNNCTIEQKVEVSPGDVHTGSQAKEETNRVGQLPDRGPALEPLPGLQPKRKVDLARAALPDLGSLQTVESLAVRELKGVGAMLTPN